MGIRPVSAHMRRTRRRLPPAPAHPDAAPMALWAGRSSKSATPRPQSPFYPTSPSITELPPPSSSQRGARWSFVPRCHRPIDRVPAPHAHPTAFEVARGELYLANVYLQDGDARTYGSACGGAVQAQGGTLLAQHASFTSNRAVDGGAIVAGRRTLRCSTCRCSTTARRATARAFIWAGQIDPSRRSTCSASATT